MQYHANHLDDMSETEAEDPFHSSDDSEKGRDYEPDSSENSSLPDIVLHSQMGSMQIEDGILEDDNDDGCTRNQQKSSTKENSITYKVQSQEIEQVERSNL
ncbi:hypothetical protein JTB14_013762 [Gonioctena quinquepunctata]|nr:hypothetical protein JTB14_013762 [Gonioctena quinquepunctata]